MFENVGKFVSLWFFCLNPREIDQSQSVHIYLSIENQIIGKTSKNVPTKANPVKGETGKNEKKKTKTTDKSDQMLWKLIEDRTVTITNTKQLSWTPIQIVTLFHTTASIRQQDLLVCMPPQPDSEVLRAVWYFDIIRLLQK